MLREIRPIMQIEGEPKRKWFSDDYFDLIVWLDETGNIVEFRLCYDLLHDQRVLIWRKDSGFSHDRVYDGEGRPGKHKSTPILVPEHQTLSNFGRETKMLRQWDKANRCRRHRSRGR